MSNPQHSDSIIVDRRAEVLYDMVADVTRIGEWSPVCQACWWDEGGAARVGDWFTGRNVLPGRTWQTRSEVVVADSGREFAFVVGGSWVRWGYTFTALDQGTRVTESWEFLAEGLAVFRTKFGADAQTQISERTRAAHDGIPVTLAAIKATAESPTTAVLRG